MKQETKGVVKKVSYVDTNTGRIKVGLEKEKIDWDSMVSGSFKRSPKHINMRDTDYDYYKRLKKK
jgi:hypothetical protein